MCALEHIATLVTSAVYFIMFMYFAVSLYCTNKKEKTQKKKHKFTTKKNKITTSFQKIETQEFRKN